MSEKAELVVNVNPGGGQVQQSSSTSMSQTSEVSSSGSSSGSSSSKVTKQVTKTVKTSSSTTVKKSSSSSSQRSISIQSASDSFSDKFGSNRGIDVDAEMKRLMDSMHTSETSTARQSLFRLSSLEPQTSGSQLIQLDRDSIMDYIDEADKDKLKFNFDVSGYSSQTIVVKSDGNKIEVNARKTSRVGDEERSEEFSRTYQMPTQDALDASKVTSQFYKDGILSVELPINLALGS